MKFNLKRKTNSTSFIPEIDGLRFFAIITVVLFHLNTVLSKTLGFTANDGITFLGGKETFFHLGWWVVRLDLGVKVFFSISGFVLALPFIKRALLNEGRPFVVKDYLIRRLTRLEPPFVISLILFFIVHLFVLHEKSEELWPHFLAGFVYMHGFVFGYSNPINPVTWSLEVEAQFYVLVPLLFWFIFKVKGLYSKILIVAFLGALSVYLKGYFWILKNSYLSDSILAYFTNFCIGILFAFLFVMDKEKWLKSKSYLFDFFGYLCIFFIFYFYKPQYLWYNNVFFNISVFGLMITTFKGKSFNYFFTRPWVFIIGGMCYSIYLLHYAFFYFLISITSEFSLGRGYTLDYITQIVISLPIVFLISLFYYLLIERPFMNIKSNLNK